jgi:hypothetical protein
MTVLIMAMFLIFGKEEMVHFFSSDLGTGLIHQPFVHRDWYRITESIFLYCREMLMGGIVLWCGHTPSRGSNPPSLHARRTPFEDRWNGAVAIGDNTGVPTALYG